MPIKWQLCIQLSLCDFFFASAFCVLFFFLLFKHHICLSNHLIRPTLKVGWRTSMFICVFNHRHRHRHRYHHQNHDMCAEYENSHLTCSHNAYMQIKQSVQSKTHENTFNAMPCHAMQCNALPLHCDCDCHWLYYCHFHCHCHCQCKIKNIAHNKMHISTSIQIICSLILFVFELTDRTGWSS